MNKLAYFVTIIFFLAVTGFLTSTSAQSFFNTYHSGPYSIVTDSQVAQVNVVQLPLNINVNGNQPTGNCELEVKFFWNGAEFIGAGCMISITENDIGTCSFNPADFRAIPEGRNQYFAKVKVPAGSAGKGCKLIMKTEVYNISSEKTMAVYRFDFTGQVKEFSR